MKLHDAVEQNNLPEVKRLLADSSIQANELNACNDEEWTALQIAAKLGFLEIVEELLSAGAEVNVADPDGNDALIFACEGGHTDIAKTLILHGAEIDREMPNGLTPLLLACQRKQNVILDLLLEAGANATKAVGGITPIKKAQRARNNDAIRTLQAHLQECPDGIMPVSKRPQWTHAISRTASGSVRVFPTVSRREDVTVDAAVVAASPAVVPLPPTEVDYHSMIERAVQAAMAQQQTQTDSGAAAGVSADEIQAQRAAMMEAMAAFEKRMQEREIGMTQFLDSQKSYFDQLSRGHQSKYQEKINAVLERERLVPEELSEEQMAKVMRQVRSELGTPWETEIEKLLEQQQSQQELHKLEQEIIGKISLRQEGLAASLGQVQVLQDAAASRTDEMYQAHVTKRQRLAEQQDLQTPLTVKVFYNAIEQRLSAKVFSAIQLAAGMIKREDTKRDKAGKFAAKVASGLIGEIPGVGGLLGAFADFAIEEGVGEAVGRKQDKKYRAASATVGNFKGATKTSELIARRLAQHYRDHIESQTTLKPETAHKSGQNAADAIYNLLKSGKLRRDEGKIPQLLRAVDIFAQENRSFLNAKSGAPAVRNDSPAQQQHVRQLTDDLQGFKAQTEAALKMERVRHAAALRAQKEQQQQIADQLHKSGSAGASASPKFSLSEPASLGQAKSHLLKACAPLTQLGIHFSIVRVEEKTLFLDCTAIASQQQQHYRHLARALANAFKDEIENVGTIQDDTSKANYLKIQCQDDFARDDLKTFLETCSGLINAPGQAPAAQPTHYPKAAAAAPKAGPGLFNAPKRGAAPKSVRGAPTGKRGAMPKAARGSVPVAKRAVSPKSVSGVSEPKPAGPPPPF